MTKAAAVLFAATLAAGVWGATSIQASAAERDWSGFYVGPNLGAAWSDVRKSLRTPIGDGNPPYFYPADAEAINAAGSIRWRHRELSIGGQAGYSVQFGNLLLGAEIDIGRLGFKGQASSTQMLPSAASNFTTETTVKANNLATLRARLGYAAGGGLLYVTGGLAYSKVSFNQTTVLASLPTNDDASETSHRIGWTVGAGAEFALDRNWTIKAEYLYADLGSFRTTTYPDTPWDGGGQSIPFAHSVDLTTQIARLGLNYKF
ncbi:MAG: porin family protein [Hyphomicrobium sp.]|nr:porin family protein [Hyphomicrobium sp.]